MKKREIVLLAFVTALTVVSCQKEAMEEAETTPTGEGMTISAVSEGIGVAAKADLAYKYDVIWRKGDKICVKNSEKSVEFTLTGGQGTTKGTFSSGESISGEVEGFYPASVANLIWPAEQQNNQVPPMYCKKTLSSTQNQTFNFASLGSVLQLNFNSTTAGIVLKSIEVKADEAMSGAFTIENGQAKVSQPEGDKPGITLDLGEGVALGTSAKKFNIAVPAGEYHGLSIIFTATDGAKCTINAKKDKAIEIMFNTVNTLAISGEFKPDILPGVFTVADDGLGNVKKVHFSKGNLWADSSNTLHFEDAQWKSASKGLKDANHVSHFTWSDKVADAVGDSYSGSNLFCDEANKQSVDGSDKIYYALSTAEWQYLFNYGDYTSEIRKDKCKWATVNGVGGYVIAPDDFTGTLEETYANDTELADAGNLVFLPAAGIRDGSDVNYVGVLGDYWSSTASDSGFAYDVCFSSSSVSPDDCDRRRRGFSVRLITESNSPYVAKIGANLYTSVQEAFNASKDNETIVLLKNTNKGSDQYTGNCGNNITFDLNGHKIESNNGQGVFHFQMSSCKTINFVDSKGNGGLVLLDSNPSSDTYGAICANGANVNIYAGYYETTPAYYGWTQVLYAKEGNITVYDGNFVGDLFTDNQFHHKFPDFYPEANTIEIFGGVFTGKVLDSYAEEGVKSEVVIHGGKFSFNPTDFLAPGATCSGTPDAEGYYVVTSNN